MDEDSIVLAMSSEKRGFINPLLIQTQSRRDSNLNSLFGLK